MRMRMRVQIRTRATSYHSSLIYRYSVEIPRESDSGINVDALIEMKCYIE